MKLKRFISVNNRLKYIPKELCKFTNLQDLALSTNKLKSVSKNFYQLINLRKIIIGYNKLKNLNFMICRTTKKCLFMELQALSVYENKLKHIPKQIGELNKLRELYIANNLLKSLPKELGKLIHLQHLNYTDNPLKVVPEEILQLKRIINFGNERPKFLLQSTSDSKS